MAALTGRPDQRLIGWLVAASDEQPVTLYWLANVLGVSVASAGALLAGLGCRLDPNGSVRVGELRRSGALREWAGEEGMG